MITVLIVLLFIVHFWFLLSIGKINLFAFDTWKSCYDKVVGVYYFKKWVYSWYWGLKTLTIVGYGDFIAKSVGKIVLTYIWILLNTFSHHVSLLSFTIYYALNDTNQD